MNYKIKIDRVHPIEYTMPLKRPYGTARGITKASTSFLIRLHASAGERSIIAAGEAQPRRKLTGDISTDVAWTFFKKAARSLVGEELKFNSAEDGLAVVRSVMNDLNQLARNNAQDLNAQKPFRGCLLGLEVALLDLVAQTLGISISDLLGRVRDEVQITVRTLSTQNTLERFRDRVEKQAKVFPMVRVKGKGDIAKDVELLELIHSTDLKSGVNKPIWMDLNEGYDPDSAKEFIEVIAEKINAEELPNTITLEQPIPATVGEQLPELQALADQLTADSGTGDIRIMPDESIWDIEDLEKLNALGGCRAMNIKSAKAGGILASLDLARRAVELNPETNICIGGMVGTSDLTTWSLLHLGRALPRLDYITAVPPSNVETRFTDPLASLKKRSSILDSTEEIGLGTRVVYEKLIPYIKRHAWYPNADVDQRHQNVYESAHLRDFGKTQLDNHLLERECLALGLDTFRTSNLAFEATDAEGRSIGFSWTKSTASSRTATAITSDKHSTRLILAEAGVPVPKGRRFSASAIDRAISYSAEIGYPVVMKPLRGTGGRGVVTDIKNADELRWAFEALEGTAYENKDVVVEEQIMGSSGRAFVVGDNVLSMIRWPHGEIEGDGSLTVGELLFKKHRTRLQNPHLMNRPIKFDEGTNYQLARQGVSYDDVLPRGERAIFSLNPNPQQGGETADAISELHPSFIEASIQAVKTIPGLSFSGVDWIIPDHTKPLSEQRAAICELNAHPSQSGNEFPLYGTSSKVSRAIVELSAKQRALRIKERPAERITVRVIAKGRFEENKYINWLGDQAKSLDLSGYVRPWGKRTVQAVLSGHVDTVTALVSRAIDGPRMSRVDSVETTHISDEQTGRFKVGLK